MSGESVPGARPYVAPFGATPAARVNPLASKEQDESEDQISGRESLTRVTGHVSFPFRCHTCGSLRSTAPDISPPGPARPEIPENSEKRSCPPLTELREKQQKLSALIEKHFKLLGVHQGEHDGEVPS